MISNKQLRTTIKAEGNNTRGFFVRHFQAARQTIADDAAASRNAIESVGDSVDVLAGEIQEMRQQLSNLNTFIHERAEKQDKKAVKTKEGPAPDPDELVCVELVFKANYLSMFLKRGWLESHTISWLRPVEDWIGRHECMAHVKRRHLPDFKRYCSCEPKILERNV